MAQSSTDMPFGLSMNTRNNPRVVRSTSTNSYASAATAAPTVVATSLPMTKPAKPSAKPYKPEKQTKNGREAHLFYVIRDVSTAREKLVLFPANPANRQPRTPRASRGPFGMPHVKFLGESSAFLDCRQSTVKTRKCGEWLRIGALTVVEFRFSYPRRTVSRATE